MTIIDPNTGAAATQPEQPEVRTGQDMLPLTTACRALMSRFSETKGASMLVCADALLYLALVEITLRGADPYTIRSRVRERQKEVAMLISTLPKEGPPQ